MRIHTYVNNKNNNNNNNNNNDNNNIAISMKDKLHFSATA